MEHWESLLSRSITTPEQLSRIADVDAVTVRRIHTEFPLRINPYYFSLIKTKGDAIWKQAIPDARELIPTGFSDPLSEEHQSPVPNLVHRYPDRVLFYVSASYCM
jgi:lysine 2,3-aminomutase